MQIPNEWHKPQWEINLLDRFTVTRAGTIYVTETAPDGTRTIRQLQTPLNRTGYQYVSIDWQMHSVGQLVAERYLPPKPSPRHVLARLDGRRNNDHCENLAWMTRGELQKRAFAKRRELRRITREESQQ